MDIQMMKLYVVAFVIIFITKWIYRWRNPKCSNGGILPPGSSGLPIIGERLDYKIPIFSLDIHPFFKSRLHRYGPIFRTNVEGRNVVVTCDREINQMIFRLEENLVEGWYVDRLGKLFESVWENCNDAHSIHKYMRDLVPRHFGVDSLKKKNLFSHLEQVFTRTLHSWSLQDSVECKSASIDMFREFGAKQLYNCDPESAAKVKNLMHNVKSGVSSFPLYIPGTKYYSSLKSKEKLLKMMGDIVNQRLQENNVEDDLLSLMINDIKTFDFLTPQLLTKLLFTLPFITYYAIPPTLAFALKFIAQHPPVLQALIDEHEEILRKRQNADSSITWEGYKSMTFTLQVVNETLRLTNSLPGVFRKAAKDINVKGYTIPAGWGIIVNLSAVHLDPKLFKDPLKFNPWRWKEIKSEVLSKTLRPFGGGMMQCPGGDFARASICLFLHVLVTKYRWAIVKGGDTIQDPALRFKNDLYIKVSEK